jgi:hypothetical protein
MERVGERAVMGGKKASEHVTKRLAERTSDRLVSRLEDRLLEKTGAHLEATGSRIAEKATERVLESGGRGSEQLVSKIVDRFTYLRQMPRWMERITGVSSERLIVRAGRGLLITLPALGGIFALYLLKSDIRRLEEEYENQSKPSALMFFGAGAADMLDAFLHFFIAYAVFSQMSHTALVLPEKMSMGCAIISTLLAVFGEVLSLHRIRKSEMPPQQESVDEQRKEL